MVEEVSKQQVDEMKENLPLQYLREALASDETVLKVALENATEHPYVGRKQPSPQAPELRLRRSPGWMKWSF
jgi:hypothetical protein